MCTTQNLNDDWRILLQLNPSPIHIHFEANVMMSRGGSFIGWYAILVRLQRPIDHHHAQSHELGLGAGRGLPITFGDGALKRSKPVGGPVVWRRQIVGRHRYLLTQCLVIARSDEHDIPKPLPRKQLQNLARRE